MLPSQIAASSGSAGPKDSVYLSARRVFPTLTPAPRVVCSLTAGTSLRWGLSATGPTQSAATTAKSRARRQTAPSTKPATPPRTASAPTAALTLTALTASSAVRGRVLWTASPASLSAALTQTAR